MPQSYRHIDPFEDTASLLFTEGRRAGQRYRHIDPFEDTARLAISVF